LRAAKYTIGVLSGTSSLCEFTACRGDIFFQSSIDASQIACRDSDAMALTDDYSRGTSSLPTSANYWKCGGPAGADLSGLGACNGRLSPLIDNNY